MSLRDDFAEDTFENRMVHEAIRSTEREIFHDAFDEDPPDDGVSAWEDEAWDTEGIDGERHSDAEMMNELAGEEDEPAQHQQQHYQQPVHDPQPDMFADPAGHSEWILRQAAAGHIPGLDYATNSLGPMPDMFGDPEGYTNWMLNASAHMAGVHEKAEVAFNDSFANAHEQHPEDFASAWNLIMNAPMHQRRGVVAELARIGQAGGDPGQFLVSQFVAGRAHAEHNRKAGLPYRREMLRAAPINHAARSQGIMYERPTSREAQLEESIFNSAWDD